MDSMPRSVLGGWMERERCETRQDRESESSLVGWMVAGMWDDG